jgi:hypothetical protein
VLTAEVVVVVGVGASFGLGGFGFDCFSGFASPSLAWDGGIAGVAGVAGLGFGGLAGVAGIAGVARSCVLVLGFGSGTAGGGEAAGSGALDAGELDGVLPELLPPLDGGGDGAAVPGVVGGVPGDGAGDGDGDGEGEGVGGVPGDGAGAGVGDGVGFAGVPPPDGGGEAGPWGLDALAAAGPLDARTGVKPKPEKSGGGTRSVAGCGCTGETNTGTVRTCVLGTASSRVNDCSLTVKAWSQSWADATAPAATAPT